MASSSECFLGESLTKKLLLPCKDLIIVSLILNEECGTQIMSKFTDLLMMRINVFFLLLNIAYLPNERIPWGPLGDTADGRTVFPPKIDLVWEKEKLYCQKHQEKCWETTKGSAHRPPWGTNQTYRLKLHSFYVGLYYINIQEVQLHCQSSSDVRVSFTMLLSENLV